MKKYILVNVVPCGGMKVFELGSDTFGMAAVMYNHCIDALKEPPDNFVTADGHSKQMLCELLGLHGFEVDYMAGD